MPIRLAPRSSFAQPVTFFLSVSIHTMKLLFRTPAIIAASADALAAAAASVAAVTASIAWMVLVKDIAVLPWRYRSIMELPGYARFSLPVQAHAFHELVKAALTRSNQISQVVLGRAGATPPN